MKAPLSWLKEFVDINTPIETLAQRLTLAGMEVADIIYIGLDEAELPWNPEQILVANILEVKPHPNADRLVLADVDYGGPQPHTVVTGAPNLFPFKGQGRLNHPLKSVFAREGARLYDGHAEGKVITTLKGRPVRGVMSDAMLCSEKELGISDEHEGIIFLEDDAPVGMPLRDFMGDVVLDLDLTPNYARCLSIVGVAREIAALTGVALHLPDPQVQMEGPPITDRATVTVTEPQLCPRFTAGLIEGVTIGPSPEWMQRRLRYAGMRPVNNIVDISNYVMLEWGEPSHAFDADRVRDQHLIVRRAQPGERLTTLDGKDRDLTPGEESGLSHPPLLVCDPAGPSGVAGVMGGEDSEVRDTTTRVLLEAAIWEPGQIRRTARELKLPSEASRRFERGVDYEVPLIAQRRAIELMRTIAGGKVA
ncbi:MAG: phenylalanine--tRNA ligase subunit beta, partial [Chloroflexales bacterium]|nr:phenylalanine--tRNA ligase subunit beta [Chloroflexales bacterium]